MGNYATYPEYKDSGIAWFGEIPEHWEIKQVRFISTIYSGSTPKSNEPEYWDGDIVWITPEDLGKNTTKEISISRRTLTLEGYASCGASLAKAGSIVISTRAPIGHIAKTTTVACVNQGCRILEPTEGITDYWYYTAVAAVPELQNLGQGTTFLELPRQTLASVRFPVPSTQEQAAIARFLDRKTAQIDALIAKKEALLAKLAEKRTALISQAVTRGLDPTVPMKDSGIEWLGKIPEQWQVLKFRYCCTITQGQVDPRDDRFSDRILIAPNHIESGTGRILYTETALDQGAISGKYLVEPEDIIYSKIRPELNKACISAGHWLCSADMYPIKAEKQLYTRYLILFLLSEPFRKLMIDESMRVAMPKVNRETLAACPVVCPPKSEQLQIVEYLDDELLQLDTSSAKIQQVIAKLQEYRTALITAAVTGKIDVRSLPEASPPMLPEMEAVYD